MKRIPKIFSDEVRQQYSEQWYEQRRAIKRRNYQNFKERRKRINAIWKGMDKQKYARKEILGFVKIIEAILRKNWLKNKQIRINNFAVFGYEIYDYERGGLIGVEGKVMLSILKAKFRPSQKLRAKLDAQMQHEIKKQSRNEKDSINNELEQLSPQFDDEKHDSIKK